MTFSSGSGSFPEGREASNTCLLENPLYAGLNSSVNSTCP